MDGFYNHNQLQRQQQQQLHHQPNMSQQHQNRASGQQQMTPVGPNGNSQQSGQPATLRDSLGDIIRDNQSELHRRQSMSQVYENSMNQNQHHSPRRMSTAGSNEMMTFGSSNNDLNPYRFNQQMNAYPTINTNLNMGSGMGNQMGNYMQSPHHNDYSAISPDLMGSMIPSTFANMSVGQMRDMENQMNNQMNNQLASNQMNNQMSNQQMGNQMNNQMNNQMGNQMGVQMGNQMNSPMNQLDNQMNQQLSHQMNMGNRMSMGNQMNNQMANQMDNQMDNHMVNQMEPQLPNNSNIFSGATSTSMGQFTPGQLSMNKDFGMDLSSDGSMSATPTTNNASGSMDMNERDNAMNAQQSFTRVDTSQGQIPTTMSLESNLMNLDQNLPSLSRQVSTASGSIVSPSRENSNSNSNSNSSTTMTQPTLTSEAVTPSSSVGQRESSKEKTVYSKSGFDMLKALWLVATRKDPQLQLGAVDMSCAFVVCDVTMNDCPIVYVSDNFQNLTGYSQHEIMGQNCRFLQAPDGKVEAGSKREFVDDGAVYNLKKMIHEGREVQQSLINYRKGGKPFLNLLTMIPIPWDTDEIRYFIGFQIDLVECPDAIAQNPDIGGVKVNYKHSDIGQYIWSPPATSQWDADNSQTLGVDDVSALLQQFSPKGLVSDWHKQSWDKMLLENTDDVVHVLSLKGLFLYLSPACKRLLEYDAAELVGNSLSTVCHPSDIVPVTRELKDAAAGSSVNIVFRIRRKDSGYTWFESHGSLFVEQGKGRKCLILVGRKRPVFALYRRHLEANGGIGDSELWTKLSTSGMFLFVSSTIRSLLDLQPENLVGTSIQDLMRKESRAEFGRAVEKARRGRTVTCKHEVQNRRGQVLQAQTILYPGDAAEGDKPSFLLAQTKLVKASARNIAPAGSVKSVGATPKLDMTGQPGPISQPAGTLSRGSQDAALASEDNLFEELRTTKCSSWQFELRQMEKVNRILAEELGGLLSKKKKRKRRKGVGNVVRDCANCHTRNTPEWRRGPSGQRDLCNSCGLRWAKQVSKCEQLLDIGDF